MKYGMQFLGPDTPALGVVEDCNLSQNQAASTVARFWAWSTSQEKLGHPYCRCLNERVGNLLSNQGG